MGLNIVVIGTGIGGLSAAIALAGKGHNVTVLDATPKLQAVGGLIVVQANASRLLSHWGIYPSFLRICHEQPGQIKFYRYNGDEIVAVPSEDSERLYGFPLWSVHRADYQRVLYAAATANGAIVRLGCAVTSVDSESDEPSVTLKSGEIVRAEVVIAADGVKSLTRDILNPSVAERGVKYAGYDITRFNIPKRLMESDPLTADLAESLSLWNGPNTGLATVPLLHDGEWYTSFDVLHPTCSHSQANSGGRPMDLEELASMFSEWGPTVHKLFSYVPDTVDKAHVWQINETFPTHWTSTSGRVCTIGDASHAVVPNAGQGGGLATEDAAVLAECLDRALNKPSRIPECLKAYEQIRKPRCKLIQDRGRHLKESMMLPDGPAQRARDQILKTFKNFEERAEWDGVHIDELPDGFMAKDFSAWQNGFDAVGFANRKLDEIFGPAAGKKEESEVSSGHQSHMSNGNGIAVGSRETS